VRRHTGFWQRGLMTMPVLLIHGHPFDHTMWDAQAVPLRSAGHPVLTPDLRGYGVAPVPAGPVTLFSAFVADLIALLDAEGITRAVVGGVSMGGQIAMEFHRLHPERVAGLVLADTSPLPETDEGRAFRRALADRLIAEGMAGYAAENLDKMITPEHVKSMPEVAAHVRRMMLATDPAGAAAALRGRAERPDHRPSLAAATVPALVLVGAEDVFTPVDQAELIRDLIPDSSLVVIDDAGHLPGMEQPEAFTKALLHFLADRRLLSGAC
jgi:pimeloyl-ACP methyl ester carboxylesterase